MNTEKHIKRLMSVAIITRNEEERLHDCLKSVAFADEVIVVDSGSTDKTVEVAKSFGAKVLIEKWRGFSAQKQFAVDQCKNEWILILDADERIPNETAEVITEELSCNEYGIEAYSFRRKNFMHGQWIRHCGWWPDRIVRLVNRKNGNFDGRPVHERWITEGKVKEIDSFIEHISFRNYSELVAKMEDYSSLSSKELFKNNVNITTLTPISHSLWMFIKTYFLELGFLDGFDGFMISIMNAGGSFLKYAKLRELYTYGKKSGG